MPRASVLAWLVVVPWVLWALVRLVGLERGYPLVPLLAFTPYAAVAALLGVAAAAALRRRAAAAVGLTAALALVAVVAPRALDDDAPGAATDRQRLRILTANVLYGRVAPAELVALVRRQRVDVLSVQELTPALADALETAGLRRELPHRVLLARDEVTGTGLWARFRLAALLGPSGTTYAQAAALARVPRAASVEIVAVHPVAPVRGSVMAWRRDVRALPAAAPDGPLRVLAGDFNATLDHHELRRLLATGYKDAADRAGAGLRGTWPADGTLLPQVTIDHVLADARIGVGEVRVLRLAGTDHRPVLVELVLPEASAGRRPQREPVDPAGGVAQLVANGDGDAHPQGPAGLQHP